MKLKVQKTIEKYQMISHGETIVLAVSGGVDSMVLMDLFVKFAKALDLKLIIAHLDHAKRVESHLDAKLIQQIATKYNIPFEKKVLVYPDSPNFYGNFHNYARQARYVYFKEVARKYRASKIATAHHADDHLETILDRLMKTNFPAGLIGIRPKGIIADMSIIRPLIEIEKKEIYDYAQTNAITFNEDASNKSDDYLRNRIRQRITPHLITERPNITCHVRQLSDHLIEDEAYFNQQIDQLMTNIKQDEKGYELSLSWLMNLSPSLFRRLILRLLPELTHGAFIELKSFLNQSTASGICHVGNNKIVSKSYDHLFFHSKGDNEQHDFSIVIEMNCENTLPDGRKIVLKQGKNLESRGEMLKNHGFDEKSKKNEAQDTHLCYNSIRLPLTVRNRRSGDRIQLIAQNGHASVKKIMIDAKVPIYKRDSWPIIADANDRIIWIPGLKKSPVCLDKPNSSEDLWLEIYE